MTEVHIITSSRTASASELVINGLDPYIDVVVIGDKTVGKNVASITVKDWIDDDLNVNPNHKWAMQPIILKIANSEGYADFDDGLVPTQTQKEAVSNLGVLGDINEPLLAKTLEYIGVLPGIGKPVGLTKKYDEFSSSKYFWENLNGSILDKPVGEFQFPSEIISRIRRSD